MLRLGAKPHEMRNLNQQDAHAMRLKLLIVMTRAYLEDCPIGKFRADAVLRNASEFDDVVPGHFQAVEYSGKQRQESGEMAASDLFNQRLQLLAVMAKAFANGYPIGQYRRKAMANNIEEICGEIGVGMEISSISCLKVA